MTRQKIEVPPEATCPRCKRSNRDTECRCYESGEFYDLQRKLKTAETDLARVTAERDALSKTGWCGCGDRAETCSRCVIPTETDLDRAITAARQLRKALTDIVSVCNCRGHEGGCVGCRALAVLQQTAWLAEGAK